MFSQGILKWTFRFYFTFFTSDTFGDKIHRQVREGESIYDFGFFFFFQFITFFFQTKTESFEKNVSISNLLLISSLSKIYMLVKLIAAFFASKS